MAAWEVPARRDDSGSAYPARSLTDARDAVAWAIAEFAPDRRVVVTSLQSAGVVVADLAVALDPDCRVATIDTGRLPEATLGYLDALRERWGRPVEVWTPHPTDLEPFLHENGANPFYASVDLRVQCCYIRKVRPLQRLLADVDCWMTGLRRDQSRERAAIDVIELDQQHGGIVKLNPLAGWSAGDVIAYLEERAIPAHPLYRAGYASIGCDPCTRPVEPGEDPRAGRWWWEEGIAKECGMNGSPLRVLSVAAEVEPVGGGTR